MPSPSHFRASTDIHRLLVLPVDVVGFLLLTVDFLNLILSSFIRASKTGVGAAKTLTPTYSTFQRSLKNDFLF